MMISKLGLLLAIIGLLSGSEAYHYSTSFISQVTTYPNIVTQKSRCMPGRSGSSGSSTQNVLICDPNEVLSADQLGSLNRLLLKMQESINSDRAKCDRSYPRPTIAVALVDSIRFGRADEQTDKNVIDYAAIFTYYLFESWRLPTTCESESDKIVIFYSKNDGVIYIYAGENLREKLPKDAIRRTSVESKAAFGSGVYEGLKYILKRFEDLVTTNRSGMFGTR
ncbi:unnamed protein product [Rodentolepis nana]|uniref:TPM_phosphatase domain-containing protein n=1 Tax=Rodentolepis nana TaxID=102285 RepID=A0A0R3T8J8_RODNA|nr:unnamed protein product [Rodentolepis nana]